jgi:DNA sulfur modification protein DndE
LTRKLGLGTENVIARINTYSLSQDKKLDLNDIKDAGGKEYSKSVFGIIMILLGLLCVVYTNRQGHWSIVIR